MERASQELAACRYFDAERDCQTALVRAYAAGDYDRMARILLPLQECRRQKRDLAVQSGRVELVTGELPAGRALRGGCYLVAPPRVGVDGRALREAADRKKSPVLVLVREPMTRDGKWPIVAIGPVTVRTRVEPPKAVRPSRGKTAAAARAEVGVITSSGAVATLSVVDDPVPSVQWLLEAAEALGDAAIAQVPVDAPPEVRAHHLMDRLAAHPDHEKLHQALEEACREAARTGRGKPDPRRLGGESADFLLDDTL